MNLTFDPQGDFDLKKFVAFTLIIIALFLIFLFVKNIFMLSMTQAPLSQVPDESQEIYSAQAIPERNIYTIYAEYDGKDKIKAVMDFICVNKTEKVYDVLYFHLYPNIFSSPSRVPFFKGDLSRVFPEGFSYGAIQIKQVKQEDKDIKWSFEEDGEILKLFLAEPISAGNFSSLHMQFEVTIPKARFRFGYQTFGNDKITVSLGNWYPILAVCKDGKWSLDRHYAIGDCTYADVSDYTVNFTVPEGFIVAASGVLLKNEVRNNKAVYIYSIDNVREFGAAISNNYQTSSDEIDGIIITSYFHPEDKQGGFMALNIAKYALGIFNESFGKYPYPELRIAEANYYPGGMEFPTFIMMDTAKYTQSNISNLSLERSTAHEVAHQWWYGLVGSDQINEPWLDEGITEFSTAYYFEKRYGQPGRDSYFERYVNTSLDFVMKNHIHMLDPLQFFKNQQEYFPTVYTSGVLFYEDLRNQIGEENLLDFLRSYLETFKYKNVSLKEFEEFLRGKKYEALDESFYAKWLNP